MAIASDGNRIIVTGEFARDDLLRLLAALYKLVENQGYKDLVLDFTGCTRAYSAHMLALCSRCLKYWKQGTDVELILPNDPTLSRLFINTNWAHLIDFRNFEESRFRGYTHAPAFRFSNGPEQSAAVSKTVDILLAAISHFKRDELRYIEWVVNEITDNVINHSQSPIGGLVQVTNFRQREQIELIVVDGGLGIPATLRPTHSELHSDSEALHAAIREGVTRDTRIGQGNGLYGSWSVCQKTEGQFSVLSGYATLVSPARGDVSSLKNTIPFDGTLITARIGYSDRFDLSRALTFGGKPHVPADYIDTHFDQDANGNIRFRLADECSGFGSRALGEPVRRKLANLAAMDEGGRISVDLEGVMLISSSYADEVFGKLFIELGPLHFMRKIELVNVDPLVQNLIDRAITQRIAVQ